MWKHCKLWWSPALFSIPIFNFNPPPPSFRWFWRPSVPPPFKMGDADCAKIVFLKLFDVSNSLYFDYWLLSIYNFITSLPWFQWAMQHHPAVRSKTTLNIPAIKRFRTNLYQNIHLPLWTISPYDPWLSTFIQLYLHKCFVCVCSSC